MVSLHWGSVAVAESPLESERVTGWTPELPAQSGGSVSLEPEQSRAIEAGGYTDVLVKRDATLTLGSGTYLFDSLILDADSHLVVNQTSGPTVIYVNDTFTFKGAMSTGSLPSDELELLVVVLGGSSVVIERAFVGTVFAPRAPITLGPDQSPHVGAF